MAEIPTKEPTLTLVSSDGISFVVPESAAVQSKTIKNMVEDGCSGEPIPLLNVTAKVLTQVIVYLKNHASESESDSEEQKNNDKEFLNVSIIELCDYIKAASYLHIPQLIDLVAQKIADTIQDKSPAWVRKFFGIENDYSAEEEEEVRKEYDWVFDGINDD